MDPTPQGALELAQNNLPSWNSHLQVSTRAIPSFKTELQKKCLRKTVDPMAHQFPTERLEEIFATAADIATLEPCP